MQVKVVPTAADTRGGHQTDVGSPLASSEDLMRATTAPVARVVRGAGAAVRRGADVARGAAVVRVGVGVADGVSLGVGSVVGEAERPADGGRRDRLAHHTGRGGVVRRRLGADPRPQPEDAAGQDKHREHEPRQHLACTGHGHSPCDFGVDVHT